MSESAAKPHITLRGDRAKVIDRNARAMKPQEYAWLKAQEFQPPTRVELIEAYERLHGAKS